MNLESMKNQYCFRGISRETEKALQLDFAVDNATRTFAKCFVPKSQAVIVSMPAGEVGTPGFKLGVVEIPAWLVDRVASDITSYSGYKTDLVNPSEVAA